MIDRSAAQKGIIDLVTRFKNHFESYKDPNYKEARLRSEFINPFFENLGWDVYNKNNYAEAYRKAGMIFIGVLDGCNILII